MKKKNPGRLWTTRREEESYRAEKITIGKKRHTHTNINKLTHSKQTNQKTQNPDALFLISDKHIRESNQTPYSWKIKSNQRRRRRILKTKHTKEIPYEKPPT